jgi:hypothetical protein
MVQDVVVGTLATLNLLVSPLSSPTLSQQTYQYEFEPASALSETCGLTAKAEPNRLSAEIESLSEEYFTLGLKARLCLSGEGARNVRLTLNLPTRILGESFLEKLKPGQSYIVHGIPSAAQPGKKDSLKLTRLTDEGSMMGVHIESIPSGGEPFGRSTDFHPLSIWVDRGMTAFSDIPGFSNRALRWKRLQFFYQADDRAEAGQPAFALSADLKRIDGASKSKHR